ncbi:MULTISPECIES: anaerobic sulfatase maturase [Vibrio harveyi group]|uniref:Anaerobic sulfatase maturase n=1 Tax=Vibrio harveyi TaxID=669 RepID=A0ABM5Y2W8_VIBHA|nr:MULTISPECIES: anaerobic sulfatase maturase [Vibrio harveyi group]AMF99936.1 anaerobic sulfatase maturase [Vibrio harveyi]EKO3838769.1 anaerobic sulfatase maturase [Vibrio harveyi]ELI6426045.1 anaerobic sulfatase maturase [Vibrio harveyi]NIY86103.1 anaerobic sulfatase maturase [Vibrio campbellii]NVK68184.1 anaerobic sulfatase maturase [Vibrio campbellii]
MQSSYPFHIMAKPTGSTCNIQCDYCYFLGREETLKEVTANSMPLETLELYIKQYIEAQPTEQVVFSWQGGEPTLLGLDYFETIIKLQKKHNPLGKTIHNDLQTNGMLLNKPWCKFLKTHRFFVGLSIDGTQEVHDHYRHTRSGRGTHKKVLNAAALLHKYHIPFATLTCVTHQSTLSALEIYRFLRDEVKTKQMQFIPIVDKAELEMRSSCLVTTQEPYSVSPQGWGEFMTTVFDEWLKNDIGQVYIPTVEDCLAVLLNHPSSSCVTSQYCGRALAIMQEGSVYSCDHYIEDSHRLGNVKNTHLAQMACDPKQQSFGLDKTHSLSQQCQQCPYLKFCFGGCPKDRVRSNKESSPQNYLCSGLRAFYQHAIPALKQRIKNVYPQ